MSGTGSIRVDGRIVELVSYRLVRVELANGQQLMGNTTRLTNEVLAGAKLGEFVVLEMSTFDLSKGRVVEIKKTAITKNEGTSFCKKNV